MEMIEFQGEKTPLFLKKIRFMSFSPQGRTYFQLLLFLPLPLIKVNGKVNRNVIMHFLAWMFLPDVEKHSHKVRFLSDGTRCNGDGFLSSLLCTLKDKREGGTCRYICLCTHMYA